MLLARGLICWEWYKGWTFCLRTWSFQHYSKWRFAVDCVLKWSCWVYSALRMPIVLKTFSCRRKKNHRSVVLAVNRVLVGFYWSGGHKEYCRCLLTCQGGAKKQRPRMLLLVDLSCFITHLIGSFRSSLFQNAKDCRRPFASEFAPKAIALFLLHLWSKYTQIELTNEEEMRVKILTWKEKGFKVLKSTMKTNQGTIWKFYVGPLKSSRWYFSLIFAPFSIKILLWRPRKWRANLQKNTQLWVSKSQSRRWQQCQRKIRKYFVAARERF